VSPPSAAERVELTLYNVQYSVYDNAATKKGTPLRRAIAKKPKSSSFSVTSCSQVHTFVDKDDAAEGRWVG
jgi:hypothetical protein